MQAADGGWFGLTDADTKPGDRYGFVIGDEDFVIPDPASRRQPSDDEWWSEVVDPASFVWSDTKWRGRPWIEAVVYETHVGTVTSEGTFSALKNKLVALRDAGITVVELMPIAETPGQRSWGYDGVLPYAPNNAYGRPDDLKALIDHAHSLGLMVMLDVVYNHFGPSGNFLHLYAEKFFTERHPTPWGAGINVDGGAVAKPVRDFFIQNALYWLEEYHFDGLRFDAVHSIKDDGELHFLDELALRIRKAFPDRHIHLVLENENNEARRLTSVSPKTTATFDAQWDDDIHHCWHRLLTGESESYYSDFGGDTVARLGRCLAEGFAYQGDYSENLRHERGEPTAGLPPQAFVAFLQNHDQIGNRALGERLTVLAKPEQLALARAMLLLSPQIPMMFMGDEWGATTPFQFFVDFARDEALQQAVREGRAKEFANFDAFKSGKVEVPDPAARATFDVSTLNWDERDKDKHRAILQETRDLLSLRHRSIVPLLASGFVSAGYERHGAGGLLVNWTFKGGTIGFALNFEADPLRFALPASAEVLWQSKPLSSPTLAMGPWQGLVYTVRSEGETK